MATAKISAASARNHTRKPPKSKSNSFFSGMLKKIVLVCFVGFLAWAYNATRPPLPKICGSINGPPVTAPRVQLKDGRYLAYKEFGVPKDIAKRKIVFIHGFDCNRHDVTAITSYLSPEIVEREGMYIVSFDRSGYGESDPHPNRTVKSTALDIEELADQLGLGSKFYVIGFSMGGQIVWSCLKYIPHRLAGAVLLAPAVNYWWLGIPSNISKEAFGNLLLRDRLALGVSHYAPWLTYWWNTQNLFPHFGVIDHTPLVFSRQDIELMPRILLHTEAEHVEQVRQQGESESIHRDLNIGFGKWEFDPTELKYPFSESGVPVHLWQGDEDLLVPVTSQRYIAQQLPWIKYHEISGAGHLFPFADGMQDAIIQELVNGQS